MKKIHNVEDSIVEFIEEHEPKYDLYGSSDDSCGTEWSGTDWSDWTPVRSFVKTLPNKLLWNLDIDDSEKVKDLLWICTFHKHIEGNEDLHDVYNNNFDHSCQ